MTVAIGVVAHPQRLVYAERLQAQINADFISIDDGDGPNANHRKVWTELADSGAPYGVAVEDDCVVTHDFRHQLEQALKASPSPIVSGYIGRLRPPQWVAKVQRATQAADQVDAHYILSTHLLHAVCVAIRAEHIQPMLDFTATRNYLPWDESVGAYARHAGQAVTYLWPSICDHNDNLPTITRHRDGQPRQPGRVAWHVGTRNHWDSERTVTL